MATWFIIGLIWTVISSLISKRDGDWGSAFFCILIGPIGPLLFLAGLLFDKIENKNYEE